MRRTVVALAVLGGVTACSPPPLVPSPPSSGQHSPGQPSSGQPSAAARATVTTPTPTPKPAPPPAPRVTVSRTRMADGSVVTLAIFSGPVTYVLHDGSEDPGLAAGKVRAGPSVRGAERGRLLGAFNGGFKLSQGVGGYEQEGHVAAALRDGMTSLVIDRSGRARIVIWGRGRLTAVYSVRQNLPPLVLDGRPTAIAADWGLWGATLGGGEYVARSAVGQDAAGHLIYAGSMSASPLDLARALARAGARIAMELDINPEWVQLDVARRPGGPLRAAIRGQSRPADQFLAGWARDFITVLAPAGAGG